MGSEFISGVVDMTYLFLGFILVVTLLHMAVTPGGVEPEHIGRAFRFLGILATTYIIMEAANWLDGKKECQFCKKEKSSE